jgi:hypothetical protein
MDFIIDITTIYNCYNAGVGLKFDKRYWEENLKYPDWYIRLEKDLNEVFFPVVHDDAELKTYRHKIYDLVEEMLVRDQIPLGKTGPNLDKERKKVDMIVIHHSEEDANSSPFKISAIGLIRLYAPKFLGHNDWKFDLRGKPVWSGHFYKGQQVFFGYHWCVYPDGRSEQWLSDDKIGWQSGVWDINTRSIGIVLAGNYEHFTPPITQIKGVAEIIKNNYSKVDKEKILGHLEVRGGRTCPGDKFLGGWKETLINLI